MFLKFYHPNGCVKYVGWVKKGHSSRQQVKNVDIHGIFLSRFDGHVVKEFDERGNLIDMGLVEKHKIMKKKSKKSVVLAHLNNSRFSYKGEQIDSHAFGKGILYESGNARRIKYIGNWLNSQYHEKGVLYFNGEKIYNGNFYHGKFHGKGNLFCPKTNCLVFSGDFKHGLPFEGTFFTWNTKIFTGLFKDYSGFLSLPYGNDLYIGWMEGGKRTELGILYNFEMYEKYIGYWKDDMYHGEGILYDDTWFEIEYEGNFQYGEKHGKGTWYGVFEKYIGEFENNKKQGYGIIYYGDEIMYFGMWKDDCYDGKGTLFTQNGTLSYHGDFKKNEMDGQGTFYYENGNIAYNGQVKDGKYNGYGEMFHPETRLICFQGLFENGKYKRGIYHENQKIYNYQHDDWEGPGTYFSQKGMLTYQGMLKNGEYHGSGALLHDNFTIHYIGNFYHGKFHGQGYFQTYNGTIYQGNFINGLFEERSTFYHLDIYQDISKIPVFYGTMKEGSFLDGIEIKYDDNFVEILDSTRWRNGKVVNNKEERCKLQQEMLIKSYFETKDRKLLHRISKKGYLDYIQNKYQVFFSKQNLMSKKQLHAWIEKKESSTCRQELCTQTCDLFGNEIINPVQGSDGETYDESSLTYLFKRDEITHDYVNIPYTYDENGQRIPNFPTMANGKTLSGFEKMK